MDNWEECKKEGMISDIIKTAERMKAHRADGVIAIEKWGVHLTYETFKRLFGLSTGIDFLLTKYGVKLSVDSKGHTFFTIASSSEGDCSLIVNSVKERFLQETKTV